MNSLFLQRIRVKNHPNHKCLCQFITSFFLNFRFDVEDNFPTPLIVKALATPAGIRRRLKPFETPLTHCKSCTCDKTIVSRREMLTSIDLDSSYSLKFGQQPHQRNTFDLETPSRNSTKPQQTTEVSEALQNNNIHQEDYVKMSAKLV